MGFLYGFLSREDLGSDGFEVGFGFLNILVCVRAYTRAQRSEDSFQESLLSYHVGPRN